jgi:hypothetical protein
VYAQADTLQKKQVSILEVRLNKLKIRDAEAEHYNEKLKMQIDDLRKKRMVLDQSHEKVGALSPHTPRTLRV